MPFFALIGLGYGSVRVGFVSKQAIANLTQFVFYFALSAMIFEFVSKLPIEEIFDVEVVIAYAVASILVYAIVFAIAQFRKCSFSESSVEAQCAVIGNLGFLGLPMLIAVFGERAVAPLLLILTVDLVLFGSIIVAAIAGSRRDQASAGIGTTIVMGLLKNPMIMSIVAGLLWSISALPTFEVTSNFLIILGAAATPCALFAIGGSLVERSAERLHIAVWLSFAKLVMHPLAVCVSALFIFEVDRFFAGIMIVSSAIPVAGNVYIIAQHYDVAPQRASAAVLVSTILSVVSLTFVLTLVSNNII